MLLQTFTVVKTFWLKAYSQILLSLAHRMMTTSWKSPKSLPSGGFEKYNRWVNRQWLLQGWLCGNVPCDGEGQRTQRDWLSIALWNIDASNDEKLLSDSPCLKKSGGTLTVTRSKFMAHWESNYVAEGSCTTTRGFSVDFIRGVSALV